MEKEKFKLPAPIFSKVENKLPSPHFASPQGLLLPKEKQPPPMFGPNGATIPAKYLEKYKPYLEKYQKKFEETNAASKKCSQQTLWCENCEFLFKNKSQLDKHLLEYSNCTIGDCSFHGCARSVAKHIQELHTTGLYDKIKNLNTPEEIEKWREERKKRYPTMANVQLRQKVQEERKKRGERIENNRNRFGPKNDIKKSNSNGSDSQMLKRKGQTKFEQFKKKKIDERRNNAATINNRSQRTNTDSIKNNTEENIACSDEEEEFPNSNIPKFQGTSSISDYVSSRANEKKVVKNVLTSLVGMYGDSSDSDEDLSNSENEANDELTTKLNQVENSIVNNLEKVVQDPEEKEPNNKNGQSKNGQNDFDMKSVKDETNVKDGIKMNIFEKEEEIKEVSDIESEDILVEEPILRKLGIDLIYNISQNEENNKNICNLEKLIQTTEEKVLNKKNHENKSTQKDLDIKLFEDESVVNDIRISTFEKEEEMKSVSDTECEEAPDEEPILRKLADNLIPKILRNENNENICNLEKVEQSKKDKLLNNESTENNFDLKLSQDKTVVNDVKIEMFEKEGDVKAVVDTESEDEPDEEPILRKLAGNLIPKVLRNGNIYNLKKVEQSKKDKLLNNESTENNIDLKLSQDKTVVNDVKIEMFEKEGDVKAVVDTESEDAPDEPILTKLAIVLIPNISKNEENNKNICNLEKLIQTTEKVLNKKNHENKSTQKDLDIKLFEDESLVNDIRISTFGKEEEMKSVSDTECEEAPDEEPILRKLADNLIPKILRNENNENICNLEKVEQSKKDKLLNNESTENNFDLKLSQDKTVVNDVKIEMFEKEGDVKAVVDTESEDEPDEEPILRKLAGNLIPKVLRNGNIYNLEKVEQSKKDKLLTNKSTENNFDLKLSQDEALVNDVKIEMFEKEDVTAMSDITNEDIPDEKPILRELADELIPKPSNFPKESKVMKTVEKDKTHRGERFSHGGIRNGNSRKSKINSKIRKTGFLLDYSKLRKTPQNTLLEKLLEPQIRHERNVLLQCVRYVVNKNFFETNN